MVVRLGVHRVQDRLPPRSLSKELWISGWSEASAAFPKVILCFATAAEPTRRCINDFHSYAAHMINDVPARRAAITEGVLSV